MIIVNIVVEKKINIYKLLVLYLLLSLHKKYIPNIFYKIISSTILYLLY